MKKKPIEIITGLFVLIGIICIGYLTIKLGKMEIVGNNHYSLVLKFQSASGLYNGANVEMSGVKIGKVANIELDKEQYAKVIIKILKNIPISDDAIASIKTAGLIGDKYVSILQGGSEDFLKDGDNLEETESSLDLESMLSKYALGDVK